MLRSVRQIAGHHRLAWVAGIAWVAVCPTIGLPAAPATNIQSANIVISAGASRIDRFAAAELRRCLTASLGWKVTISEEKPASAAGPVFFVGSLDSGTARLPGVPSIANEKIAGLEQDGICLKSDVGNVVLTGKGARGGLYAVYAFLEKTVGCHWPEPGREYLPKHDSLDLMIDEVHNPAFQYRGVALHGPCIPEYYNAIIDWLAKNRLNTVQFSCEVYDELRPKILNGLLDRGIIPKIGAHSRQYFYSSAKYFPLHPDHFAFVKGRRTGDTQLCYSNHASIAEYADNAIAYAQARPEIGLIGLWPSDGFGFCECDRCKSGQTTDILLDYVNGVSRRIHEQIPHVKLEFLSYIHYTAPPTTIKPLPYVVPTYCEYSSRSQFHTITDERASNAKCRNQLESWVKQSVQATVYSYYADDVMKKFMYNAVSDVVVADLKFYRSIGVAGNSVLMMNPQSWWAHAPHMVAYAKASWDSAVKLKAIDEDYFNSLYGPAAKAMRAHQAAARALFDVKLGHGQTGEEVLVGFRIHKFNPTQEKSAQQQVNEAVARMRNCLAEAKAATADDYVLARIKILEQDAQLMGLIYGILNEAAGYKADKNDARKARVRDLIEQACANDVTRIDDIRGGILKSLIPHVSSVLGPAEAAKYDRVVVLPME